MGAAAVVTKLSPVLVVGPPGGDDAVVHLTSSFDRTAVPFGVTALLLFDRPIPEPAETIRAALSEALAHYRPVAGRLEAEGDGDGELLRIEGAAGVLFVAASAGYALADMTTPLLAGLVARYPSGVCRHADPLLLLQVTEFACGGFAVAATWNHVLTDGEGMAQVLGAVGELARGASPAPSIVPLRADDGSLPRLPHSMVAAQKRALSCVFSRDLALLDVTVPAGLIGRVRAEFDAAGLGDPCTVFEAVAAVLWQCRTRAAVVSASDEAPVALSFSANVRRLVGARPGYYGNCMVVQSMTATRGAVAHGTAADVARMIRRAKERVPDLLAPGAGAGTTTEHGVAVLYDTLVVSSWRNLGFEAVDFGGGRPARVTWQVEETVVPCCVVCPPGKGGDQDGVSVMSACVRPEHADAFLAELTALTDL
ncbi:acyl transferase 15-like [Triticum dicoccoides]|uniref:acyl transferase 15-like n=1 Tax=Triticum dicoccoides TaxID=85692 RepID=UPI00188F1530|nr:acyl transferase 15-like [Triticum dicoccoides]